jgi:ubiquitin
MKAIESNSKELHSQSEAGWTKNEQPNEDKSKNYMPPYFLYKKQLTKLIDVK